MKVRVNYPDGTFLESEALSAADIARQKVYGYEVIVLEDEAPAAEPAEPAEPAA